MCAAILFMFLFSIRICLFYAIKISLQSLFLATSKAFCLSSDQVVLLSYQTSVATYFHIGPKINTRSSLRPNLADVHVR